FTVSTLALMMGMTDRRRTALFMGSWTVARAFADGSANAGGGALVVLFRHAFHNVPGGYATVFAIEAIGMTACAPLLRTIKPQELGSTHDELPMAVVPPLSPLEAPIVASAPPAGNGSTTGTAAETAVTKSARAARASGSSPRRSAGATRRPRNGAEL
ncbi:MAG: PucC family protein, partial [Actinomycetota bacterium]